MNPRVIQEARNAVTALLLEYPELADNDQLRADMIEGETAFNDVVRRLVIEAKAAAGHADGVTATIKEMQDRRSRLEQREERIRALVLSLMQSADLTKLALPEATLSVSQRKPAPIKPDTADGLPEEFVRTKREPDMAAIHAAHKEGRAIPGVAISNGSVQLMIRG